MHTRISPQLYCNVLHNLIWKEIEFKMNQSNVCIILKDTKISNWSKIRKSYIEQRLDFFLISHLNQSWNYFWNIFFPFLEVNKYYLNQFVLFLLFWKEYVLLNKTYLLHNVMFILIEVFLYDKIVHVSRQLVKKYILP